MANVKHAMEAKSDQLNYEDFNGAQKVILISGVTVRNSETQPVSIFFDGDNGKPFKPCRTMIRLISFVWGEESDNWIGKAIRLYGDDSVRYGGEAVGGIRIRAFSHIDSGFSRYITLSRGKKRKLEISKMETSELEILDNDMQWINAFKADANTLEQIEDVTYRLKISSLSQLY